MSYFNSKPKEVNHEWVLPGADKPTSIPKPPEGLLKDKEYIVFHKITFLHHNKKLYHCITSFGRFFQYYGDRDLWDEVTAGIKMSARGYKRELPNYRPFYINQGCVELMDFLDNTGRLLVHRVGSRHQSEDALEMSHFIVRLLNFFIEMFPDSIITENNNDPDKYFRMGNVNPELIEILSKMESELDSWDREMDELNKPKSGGSKKRKRRRKPTKKKRRTRKKNN
jgi:hypothetical protein